MLSLVRGPAANIVVFSAVTLRACSLFVIFLSANSRMVVLCVCFFHEEQLSRVAMLSTARKSSDCRRVDDTAASVPGHTDRFLLQRLASRHGVAVSARDRYMDHPPSDLAANYSLGTSSEHA